MAFSQNFSHSVVQQKAHGFCRLSFWTLAFQDDETEVLPGGERDQWKFQQDGGGAETFSLLVKFGDGPVFVGPIRSKRGRVDTWSMDIHLYTSDVSGTLT